MRPFISTGQVFVLIESGIAYNKVRNVHIRTGDDGMLEYV